MNAEATAKTRAKKEHESLEVRDEGGKLVFSCTGQDLLEYVPGKASYTLLRNFPGYSGYGVGVTKLLTMPCDEQVIYTARDLAKEVVSGR